MKRFFVFLSLFAALFGAFAAADTVTGSLKVYSEPVFANPFPPEPGSYFDVWLKIQNPGYTVNTAECELIPKYPFSLDPGEPALKQLGQLVSYGYGYVKYTVRVASDAAQGDNTLDFRCRSETTPEWVNGTLDIPIKTNQPTLNIEAVVVDPAEIRPGNDAVITITLRNYAPNALKDVLVKMDTSAADPLAPVGGSSEKRIALIAPGASASVVFDSVVLPDTVPKVYKVPLSIQYADELGDAFSKNDVLTVVVSDSPKIAVSLDSSTIIRAGTQGKVNVKVINQGLAEAKFLRVTVRDGDGFELLSPAQIYLGTLNSDDYDTAEFTLYVKPGTTSLNLPVSIEFTDSLNKDRTQAATVPVRLYSEAEISSIGLEQQGGTSIVVIVVVLAIVAYLAYKFVYPRLKKK